jgi:hypothetical protein
LIYNHLCNQCLSPLMLWVRISIRARCTTLCDSLSVIYDRSVVLDYIRKYLVNILPWIFGVYRQFTGKQFFIYIMTTRLIWRRKVWTVIMNWPVHPWP